MSGPLDLETWIDTVQTKLNARMSERFPAADEAVSIGYSHLGSTARAVSIPRVIWGETPEYSSTYSLSRDSKGRDGIGSCIITQQVDLIAATMADCRALLVNLIQAILAAESPTRVVWPIQGGQNVKDVSHDGRLARKITITLGVEFVIPDTVQQIGTWIPTDPTAEVTVKEFVSTVGGEGPWTEPAPTP
jgi:hypothetical protein